MSSSITKKDINKTIVRSLSNPFSFGYEKQENLAFAYAMIPSLKKIYGDNKEKMSQALHRHLEFFNITNQANTFCLGVSIAMEEEAAANDDFDVNVINNTKVALMGPLSGVGDALFWGTFKILATSIGTVFSLKGSVLGPILFFLAYNIPSFVCRIGLMHIGYNAGAKFLADSKTKKIMDKVLMAATIVGLFVIGGMTATVVKCNISLAITDGANTQTISELLNGIIPCLTSLLVFLTTYWAIVVKKISSSKMILIMTVISLLGAYFGILS